MVREYPLEADSVSELADIEAKSPRLDNRDGLVLGSDDDVRGEVWRGGKEGFQFFERNVEPSLGDHLVDTRLDVGHVLTMKLVKLLDLPRIRLRVHMAQPRSHK